MTNGDDKGLRIYRKLLFFYNEKVPIHFKLETGEFRNGTIIDLSEEKLTLVLSEFVMGHIPFLLEDIREDSISQFTEVGE